MSIKFESVRWKNFLSTGNNFIEIELDKSPTTLIAGVNGTGKSTLLDAISFALFGKAFRKINKPQLINSINEKDCVVEIEFTVNATKYFVRRGIKPTIFEVYVNGKLIDQSANIKDHQEHLENNILKLNFKSFSQVVVLGSSTFVPFMQLSAADRRFIIEDLLDIQIFSAMNVVLKNRIAEVKSERETLGHKVDLAKQNMELTQKHLDEFKRSNQSRVSELNKQVDATTKLIEDLSKEIDALQVQTVVLRAAMSGSDVNDKHRQDCVVLKQQLEKTLKKVRQERDFFANTSECPTCSQTLDKSVSETKVSEKADKIKELTDALSELAQTATDLELKRVEYDAIRDERDELLESIRGKQNVMSGHQSYLKKIQQELTTVTEGSDSHSIKKAENDLKKIQATLGAYDGVGRELSEKKHYLDISSMLLKDTGIKTKIIKQYLPIINKLVNHYLSELDFFVNFNLDESFAETIKSRHRDIFSYASFSEGQKKRIDLSLLFAWRDIARLKNSANTNLLILDEVFDSAMDAQGIEDFMKLVNNLGESVNVFVISPKGDTLYDKFGRVVRFEMKGNFSRMVE